MHQEQPSSEDEQRSRIQLLKRLGLRVEIEARDIKNCYSTSLLGTNAKEVVDNVHSVEDLIIVLVASNHDLTLYLKETLFQDPNIIKDYRDLIKILNSVNEQKIDAFAKQNRQENIFTAVANRLQSHELITNDLELSRVGEVCEEGVHSFLLETRKVPERKITVSQVEEVSTSTFSLDPNLARKFIGPTSKNESLGHVEMGILTKSLLNK